MRFPIACSAALAATLLLGPASAADWPSYRGPDGSGRSAETGLISGFPEQGPKERWRVPLGNGYSGITVAGGRIHTLFGDGKDEHVVALDAASGKELWRYRTDQDRPDQFGDGPRSTPTVVGDRVYALSARGKLHALDAATGRPRWSVDLAKTYGAKVPTWGVSVSPLAMDGRLFLDIGGKRGHSLIALDAASGELVWASETDKPGYSTPLPLTAAGVDQVIFFTGSAVVAVRPENGETLWRVPWKTAYDVNAATPILVPPDKVFVSSGYDVGAALYRLEKDGDGVAPREIWKSRVMKNQFNSSVLVDGHIYGFDDSTFKCIEAATGEECWKQRGFRKGSLLYADGHLWVLSEGGLLALVEATPEAYREKSRAQVLNGKTWTMPTLANGTLYLRNEKEIVAFDVEG